MATPPQPPSVPGSEAQGLSGAPGLPGSSAPGAADAAASACVASIVVACGRVVAAGSEEVRRASVAAAREVLAQDNGTPGANAVAVVSILTDAAQPTALRALVAALTTAAANTLSPAMQQHVPMWVQRLMTVLTAIVSVPEEKELLLALSRMLAVCVAQDKRSICLGQLLPIIVEQTRAADSPQRMRACMHVIRDVMRALQADEQVNSVVATFIRACFPGLGMEEVAVDAVQSLATIATVVIRSNVCIDSVREMLVAIAPQLLFGARVAFTAGDKKLVETCLDCLTSLELVALNPRLVNPKTGGTIVDLMKLVTQLLPDAELQSIAMEAGHSLYDAAEQDPELREHVAASDNLLAMAQAVYAAMVELYTEKDEVVTDESQDGSLGALIEAVAKSDPRCFWGHMESTIVADCDPSKPVGRRVAAYGALGMCLEALQGVWADTTPLLALLRPGVEASDARVRVVAVRLIRQMLFDIEPEGLDYAAMMPMICALVGDAREEVALEALAALKNVFAEEGEAPEGLASAYVDELVPKICNHFGSTNTKLYGDAMQALGVFALRAGEAILPHTALVLEPLITVLRSDDSDRVVLGGAVTCLAFMYPGLEPSAATEVLPLIMHRATELASSDDNKQWSAALNSFTAIVEGTGDVPPDMPNILMSVLARILEACVTVEYSRREVEEERSDADALVEGGGTGSDAADATGTGAASGTVRLEAAEPSMILMVNESAVVAMDVALGAASTIVAVDPTLLEPHAKQLAEAALTLAKHVQPTLRELGYASLAFVPQLLLSPIVDVAEDTPAEVVVDALGEDNFRLIRELFTTVMADVGGDYLGTVKALDALSSMLALGKPMGMVLTGFGDASMLRLAEPLTVLASALESGMSDEHLNFFDVALDVMSDMAVAFGSEGSRALQALLESGALAAAMADPESYPRITISAGALIAQAAASIEDRADELATTFAPVMASVLAYPGVALYHNNAAFSLSVFFKHATAAMQPHVETTVTSLVDFLSRPDHPDARSLDNAASALCSFIKVTPPGSSQDELVARAFDAVVAWGLPFKVDFAENENAFPAVIAAIVANAPYVAQHAATVTRFLAEAIQEREDVGDVAIAVFEFARGLLQGAVAADFWATVPMDAKAQLQEAVEEMAVEAGEEGFVPDGEEGFMPSDDEDEDGTGFGSGLGLAGPSDFPPPLPDDDDDDDDADMGLGDDNDDADDNGADFAF